MRAEVHGGIPSTERMTAFHAHLLKAWTDRQNLGRKKLSRKEGDQSPFLLSSQPALAHFIQKEACGSTDHQSSCNSAMAFVREDHSNNSASLNACFTALF